MLTERCGNTIVMSKISRYRFCLCYVIKFNSGCLIKSQQFIDVAYSNRPTIFELSIKIAHIIIALTVWTLYRLIWTSFNLNYLLLLENWQHCIRHINKLNAKFVSRSELYIAFCSDLRNKFLYTWTILSFQKVID